jgi:RNA polymerase sigma-70 factor, ECF subfamily
LNPLSPECHSDCLLIAAALRGESKAVRELVRRLTPVIQARVAQLLLRTGAGRTGRIRQEVADLTQEVFIGLFAAQGRVLRAWSPDGGAPLEAFISLIAYRKAVSLLRSRRRSPLGTQSEDPTALEAAQAPSSSADVTLVAKADVERIADTLRARLSAKGWEMFYGLYVLEETVPELAERTGESVSNIYQWRSRIKKLIAAAASDDSSVSGNTLETRSDDSPMATEQDSPRRMG